MLELWKPLWILKDKDNPVLFNEAGQKFSEWALINGQKMKVSDEHPFVIFYDNYKNCYYYLKARSALKRDKTYRKKYKGEILVKDSQYGGLFRNESYVDCSQIFKMDKEELESLLDLDSKIYKDTDVLDEYDIINILNTLYDCIMQKPPYLSILEVLLDENDKTFAKSLYLCDEKINELDEQDITELIYFEPLYSNKNNEFKQNRVRYNNGIDFCEMFLNEYFPEKVNEFKKIQGLNKNNKLDNENTPSL